MNNNKATSLTVVKKIVLMAIILVVVLSVGVLANNMNLNSVKIVFDDSEVSVVTSNTKVADILNEKNIVLLDNEYVYPDLNSNIDSTKIITITKSEKKDTVISENTQIVSTEEILDNYNSIVEEIIVVEEEIPFETITKDVSNSSEEKTDRVVQEGENGLKNVKYMVKYKNDVEIERTFISEEIVKEPVDKIIEISTKVTNRSALRNTQAVGATSAAVASSVEGKEARVVTMNVSAYTASTCGKSAGSAGYGITSSGVPASAWYTLAAGSAYPIGTVIYIPYFASQPNGGWFVVQDRGGAISNGRIDVYMNTYQECVNFGRKNLECYIY